MPEPISVESVIPDGLCSRGEFQAQRDKLESLLRDASRAAMYGGRVASDDLADMTLEREVEHRLQVLILRAKGIVSEEMLVRHQREIPVDEIPDYAVTHLLIELGERELQSGAKQ
jgi:hypothetical protein